MEQKSIDKRLERIEKTLNFIRDNMIDADAILTEEEEKMLDGSIENERSGKLVSSERLRRELGI
ncbi:MAG: hypothetical protein KJ905_02445 [Nanoarchaeota archaeon]|nr:hypothetical protein [Nanoarchaeota archaeon]